MENELYLRLYDNEWPDCGITHDRLIARAVVYDDEGMLYFTRLERSDEFCVGTVIETSGGGVETGEGLCTALRRELREELGAEVEIICRIGTVSDYYNLIGRHNINNYYLCRAVSFGAPRLTADEERRFHLSPLRLGYEEACEEYARCECTPLGRLLAARELPVLRRAWEILRSRT